MRLSGHFIPLFQLPLNNDTTTKATICTAARSGFSSVLVFYCAVERQKQSSGQLQDNLCSRIVFFYLLSVKYSILNHYVIHYRLPFG